MLVLVRQVGDGEGIEAELFVRGRQKRGREREVDVLARVEGAFCEGRGEGDGDGDQRRGGRDS